MDIAETDYPAAHSMDTAWFGVDDEGEIAIFDTGENGAVPNSFVKYFGSSLFSENFLARLPKNSMGYYLHPADAGEYLQFLDATAVDTLPSIDPDYDTADLLLIQFTHIDEVPIYTPVHEWSAPPVLFSGEEIVLVFYPEIDKRQLKALYDRGAIKSYRQLDNFNESLQAIAEAQGFTVEKFLSGLSDFEKDCYSKDTVEKGSWIYTYLGAHYYSCDDYTSVYEAQCRPADAMNIKDLPDKVSEDYSVVRLKGVTFSKAAAIQPFAFEECSAWHDRDYWAAVDGTFHRVNGPDGKPQAYDDNDRKALGVRPVGVPRVDIDYDEWPD